MIAGNIGVEYTLEPPNVHHEDYKDRMDSHTRRYWRVLQGSTEALKYLKSDRGLTEESLLKFRVGLVPEDEYKYRNDLGGIGGRITFPIMEHKDPKIAKCLAMGYRTLKDIKPKYINDVNQEGKPSINGKPAQDANLSGVFIKGNSLYGYSHAYAEIRKRNHAIVTEGYMDVISMHQANICNTVAVMGTGFTEVQMDALRKLTSNLIIFLDGDKAGVTNMFRVLPALYEKGFNVLMIVAEYGMDAADICKNFNFDENSIRAFISKKSKPAMNVVIDNAVEDYEQMVARERIKALEIINPMLEKMTSKTEQEVFRNISYNRLNIGGK